MQIKLLKISSTEDPNKPSYVVYDLNQLHKVCELLDTTDTVWSRKQIDTLGDRAGKGEFNMIDRGHEITITLKKLPSLEGLPFHFEAPEWANSGVQAQTPEEAIKRAQELAQSYYALGVQCGIHSMVEWCGVMTEYVKMLEWAHAAGIDPREVDQHHEDCKVEVPEFMVKYFTEKLGCQLKPFIRANPALWREALEDWFEGEGQHVVCEMICQKLAVSLHPTEEAAIDHAATCAMENLYASEDPEDHEDRDASRAAFIDQLTEDDSICEGDYEVHLLLPSNRKR